MGRKKSPEKQRIEHLESLIEKAADYINSLENKIKELEKDRRELLDWYWLAEDLMQDNKKLRAENKNLKSSNKALLGLLSEIYKELNSKQTECCNTIIEERVGKFELSERDEYINENDKNNNESINNQNNKNIDVENKEVEEFKSELRKIITNRMKKQNKNKLDIKG